MSEREIEPLAKRWLNRLGQTKWVAVPVIISIVIAGVASTIKDGKEVINTLQKMRNIITPKAVSPNRRLPTVPETIFFDFDKTTLRADSRDGLDKFAEWMKENPKIVVKLEGRATLSGDCHFTLQDESPSYFSAVRACLIIAERRNAAVKSYLVDRGVPPSRILTVALGIEQPLPLDNGLAVNSEKALVASEGKNRSVRIIPQKVDSQPQ